MKRGLIIAIALLLATPAVAQNKKSSSDSANLNKASKLREQGYRYAKRHRYKKALPLLEQALALDRFPDSTLMFDLGAISEALGLCRKAVLFYVGFLGAMPSLKEADEVNQKMAACKNKIELGTIEFTSVPEAQEIRLNGVPVGRTPIRGLEMPTGTYTVTAARDNYNPYKSAISVEYGLRTRHKVRLEKKIYHGNIEVKVTPEEGAVVFLNHLKMGPAPYTRKNLETKKYLIHVEKEGWDRWVRYITVPKDATLRVEVSLEKTNTKVAIPPIPE
jgi:tetratricopeptide (TPR) repeat protein